MEENSEQPGEKEQRIRKITHLYYSKKDVQKAIFEFSEGREVVPRYFEGFGKRPDSLQYPGDIFELVRKGATSFHCSEEIWKDSLKISTEMNKKQLDELRVGWDLLLDIDCPWIDYGKKAAQAIITALKFSKIKNFGLKFSGSKGFHIIVPWKAFPPEINNIQTSTKFPEWPKIIVNYLKELSRPILEDLIKQDLHEFKKLEGFTGIRCENCKNLANKSYQITVRCNNHKIPHIETFISNNYDNSKRCPDCNSFMEEADKKEMYICPNCNINSLSEPKNFNKGVSTDIFKILGLDLQLVSSRHMFRMPYSLHEKTALSSVVLKSEELKNFQPRDADPLKVKIRNFLPKAEEGEATELLREALDWYKNQHPEKSETDEKKEFSNEPIKILGPLDEIFPPTIKQILQGVKDGRKRSLFVLINFFRSIGLERDELEKIIQKWNEKNEIPLKKEYIKSQLLWSYRNKIVLPPNYDKDYYKGIGIFPTEEEIKLKNPVNYAKKKSWQNSSKTKKRKTRNSNKN